MGGSRTALRGICSESTPKAGRPGESFVAVSMLEINSYRVMIVHGSSQYGRRCRRRRKGNCLRGTAISFRANLAMLVCPYQDIDAAEDLHSRLTGPGIEHGSLRSPSPAGNADKADVDICRRVSRRISSSWQDAAISEPSSDSFLCAVLRIELPPAGLANSSTSSLMEASDSAFRNCLESCLNRVSLHLSKTRAPVTGFAAGR